MTYSLVVKKEEKKKESRVFEPESPYIFYIIDCRNNRSSKIDWALRSKKIRIECQDLYSVFIL